MGLHLVEVYRSPNIGIFLRANDSFLLAPKGIAATKSRMLAEKLGVSPVFVSVEGTRLLGPLIVMNNRGMLVSRLVEDYEVKEIASQTGLRVEKFESKFTAVGNLVAANDRGAVVSTILDQKAVSQVGDVLGVEVQRLTIQDYVQVGALMVPTNSGAAVYPKLTEKDVEEVGSTFGVEAYPASVNGGIPFLTSGLVANSSNALVGDLTTGPELIFLTKALGV
ncbi:MAG: translation initiation factor IF-6 [Nitrososphaerales archaeon]|jgi:translation initiation factor 6